MVGTADAVGKIFKIFNKRFYVIETICISMKMSPN